MDRLVGVAEKALVCLRFRIVHHQRSMNNSKSLSDILLLQKTMYLNGIRMCQRNKSNYSRGYLKVLVKAQLFDQF